MQRLLDIAAAVLLGIVVGVFLGLGVLTCTS